MKHPDNDDLLSKLTVVLQDDGSLDTVVQVTDDTGRTETVRYSFEEAASYRDDDGSLDMDRFARDVVIEDYAAGNILSEW